MASILVVDDSVSLRHMLKEILAQEGHRVSEASDGENALQIVQDDKFDLVLTDVNMPVIDGIELCRELRQMENFRFTPILMITTEATDDMKRSGKMAGATGWLVKPFDPNKLLSTVSLLCGKQK